MGVKEVKFHLGKIGVNQVRELMKNNEIKSKWVGGRLLTTKKYVDEYVEKMFSVKNGKKNNYDKPSIVGKVS
jgi:hypothetical protein